MPRYTRTIAPRLRNGDRREAIGHGLPPDIKAGLQAIARAEGQSVSWVLEQIIIDYFRMPIPDYQYTPKATLPRPVRGHYRRAA